MDHHGCVGEKLEGGILLHDLLFYNVQKSELKPYFILVSVTIAHPIDSVSIVSKNENVAKGSGLVCLASRRWYNSFP